MKTHPTLLAAALLLSGATAFAANSTAQNAAADAAASAGASVSVVTKMQRGTPLSLADLVELARGGVPDDTTLAYLRSSKASYQLTTQSFDELRASGVSDRVMNYLLLASPLEVSRSAGTYRPAPVRGYGYRPFRPGPGMGRFGGFGGGHLRGHGGRRH